MAATSDLLWRVVPGVRRTERDRFLFFFVLAALLSLAEMLGLAGSEALFLTRLGPAHLPRAFILASLAAVLGSFLYALVVGRVRNDRLFIALLLGTAFFLLVNLLLLQRGMTWVLLVLFCTLYLSQAVFVSLHYWTFATDFFDTPASKRLFPLFAAGASLGGVLGGGLAVWVSRALSSEALIATWGLTLGLAALHLRLGRGRLLRWTPVGAAEADESSVEGLRGALRYVTRSRMAFWLLLSVVGMVFSLTLMQYLYLDIFSRSFDSAEALAAFFGAYLAITNAVEILVANAVTPWLIRRFGVAQANLAHPAITLLGFAGLAIDPRLYVAVLARANRELFENALAGPIRALAYNALPRRFRGRMRALLEGVVFFGAMSIAGAALLVLGDGLDTRWLVLLGSAVALLYASANLIVRREYLRSLIGELRHGRLDLGAMASGLDSRELGGLAEHWESTLEEERERFSLSLLELATPLASRGFSAAVRHHATHPNARVRLACLKALDQSRDAELGELLRSAVDDPDVSIRRLAARLIGELPQDDEKLRSALRLHLQDNDLEVRAQVAANLAEEGLPVLHRMLRSKQEAPVVAALARAPGALVDDIGALVDAPEPSVRSAAIDSLTRLGLGHSLAPERLVADLRHSDPRVRRSAAAALASQNDETATRALAEALDDVSLAVRREAQAALASQGDTGLLAAAPLTRGSRIWTVDAALGTIAQAGGPVGHALLRQTYSDRVREAWASRLALELVSTGDDLRLRFLRAALRNALERARFLAFRALELLEDHAVVRSLSQVLTPESRRAKGDALEVLSNLGQREISQRLALLLEEDPLEEKLPALAGFVIPPQDLDQVLAEASRSQDRWLRLAAALYGRGGELIAEEEETMERLLALQSVALFTHLSLERLEIINRLLREVRFLADEVIVREGEPGHELFILVEGEVQFVRAFRTPAEEPLASMTPVSYFGEMAILDNEPRSVTVIARQDSRLLTLAGDRFKELILQAPEISFEVFPILISRIRAAESRLTQLKGAE